MNSARGTGFVIEDIKKLNVFIGKNNSGKSNVLRVIELLNAHTVTLYNQLPPQDKYPDYPEKDYY